MESTERLEPLLDRWLAEADAGRLLLAAELCRDCPELLPEVEREIAVLRQFHVLARPAMSASITAGDWPETKPGDAALEVPVGQLPRPGNRFGRYELIAELGKGGMGIVYKGCDTKLHRDVVLKVMRADVAADSKAANRFLREAKALAAIRHDHVVEIYDYGDENGVPFITMPLLGGESLETLLKRQAPLPLTEIVRIGAELAQGLGAVHAKGLIHRDLKPSNVWLEAPNGRVKLLDFGLARERESGERITRSGAIVGTPAYMSPEQVNGLELDARTDLFSLGSILYKAATGQTAFAGSSLTATLKAIGEDQPPPARAVNSAVPQSLSDLIERLHQKNPTQRPASAEEVEKALRGWTAASETATTDWQAAPTATQAEKKPARRFRIGAGFGLGSFRIRIGVSIGFSLFLIATLVAVTTLYRRRGGGQMMDTTTSDRNGIPLGSGALDRGDRLRIRSLDIHLLEEANEGKVQPRGRLGHDTYKATTNDDIRVTAELSRPAHSYIIVFRPDGKDEVLSPQSANDVPAFTDKPHYPSKDRSKVYGLSDGAGLWLVALVTSDTRLPAYAEWRKQHAGGPWKKADGEPRVVWFDDGHWLEAVSPGGSRFRGERGEKQAAGNGPLVQGVVDWLKAETGGVVSAVAFTVEAKK